MGFRDKLSSFKENFGQSPVLLTLAGQGSDAIVTPGDPATVKVLVRGENDGSVERIEISLQTDQDPREWPLGEVPVTPGVHALSVTIPAGIGPSCAFYAEYFFKGKVIRTKGIEADGLAPVDVRAVPRSMYWPDGARSGTGGPDDLRIEIALERDVVDTGDAVRGTVHLFAMRDTGKLDVDAAIGARVVSPREPKGKHLGGGEVRLEKGLRLAAGEHREFPLSLDIATGMPPTLAVGDITTIVWTVEVTAGKTSAWQIVGVVDPEAAAGMAARTGSGLADILITGR